MASGHGVSKPDQANHPGRQVGHSSFSAALDARTREYNRARSGGMSHEEAARVGIKLPHPQEGDNTFIGPSRKDPYSGDKKVVRRGPPGWPNG